MPRGASDVPQAEELALSLPQGSRLGGGAHPAIAVEDLCFRYSPAAPLALSGVSFTVPPGGRLAVVGPSGAGKSSLVNLLLRFWDYQAGSIRLEGRELRSWDPEEVHARIGVVAHARTSSMPPSAITCSWPGRMPAMTS